MTEATVTRTVDGLEVPTPGTYSLDVSHSHVGFMVRHLMVSKVRGRFSDFTGTIVIAEDPSASSVEVEVQIASIDTREDKRDGHLKSGDFFDVEQHPTMTFKSTQVTHANGDEWTVEGDLSIAGVTKGLTLEVSFEGATLDPWGGTRIGFSAKGELNREDFGLSWNQALEAGGVVVGKKATIEIEAEAVKQ
ncbi:MAG: YceI family protein [Acidimicrobiales bacterium]